jgi:hypothetical protein
MATNPSSPQLAEELSIIPWYLGSDDPQDVLDYQDWEGIRVTVQGPVLGGGSSTINYTLHVEAEQDYPVRMPLVSAFWGTTCVTVRGECDMETHYDAYIQDTGN